MVPDLAEDGDDFVSDGGIRDHVFPEALGQLSFEGNEPGWGE
jgi:hypothetical protein